MNVFVTGGTGFLGKSLVRLLVNDSNVSQTRCLARAPGKAAELSASLPPQSQCVRYVFGSLTDQQVLAESLQGVETVYHLAATLRGAPASLFLANVTGTRELIRACQRAGVGRLVLISSLAVYATAELSAGTLVTEDVPLDPEPHRRDPYTFSKIQQEHAAREEADKAGLALAIIRPGVIYGPGRECISGRVGLQFGSWVVRMGGNQPLPYTYVDNIARAIHLAGTVAAAAGQAFSVVDDQPPTARELLKRYRKSVGPVRVVPLPRWAIQPLSRTCHWYHRVSRGQLPAVMTPYKSASMWKTLHYSNAKARQILGWQPEIGFDEGLEKTFACLRQKRRAAGIASA